jgi:hypothetical protein
MIALAKVQFTHLWCQKSTVIIKVIFLDFSLSSGFLVPTVFWKLHPFVWSGEHETYAFGPRVEELLYLIEKYMTVLKKCNEEQNALE